MFLTIAYFATISVLFSEKHIISLDPYFTRHFWIWASSAMAREASHSWIFQRRIHFDNLFYSIRNRAKFRESVLSSFLLHTTKFYCKSYRQLGELQHMFKAEFCGDIDTTKNEVSQTTTDWSGVHPLFARMNVLV